MNSDVEVRAGQVWADCDWRNEGRTLRVDALEGEKAVCTVLTVKDGFPAASGQFKARQVKILLRRFKPTSTGYRLVQDVPSL